MNIKNLIYAGRGQQQRKKGPVVETGAKTS
jgi:hypothetical protein